MSVITSRPQPLRAVRTTVEKERVRRSVSRVLSPRLADFPAQHDRWPFIWGACRHAPHATHPDDGAKTRLFPRPERTGTAVPTRSCSRWGLPCPPRRRGGGALLPHPFTLTGALHKRPKVPKKPRRFAFCGTFPGVSPAGGYPAPCFRGARTFLRPHGFPSAARSHPTV